VKSALCSDLFKVVEFLRLRLGSAIYLSFHEGKVLKATYVRWSASVQRALY
jgi:hypothetical protein